MLAQITDDGIEFGKIFDNLKIDIESYEDVINKFSKLRLNRKRFKSKGEYNWDAIVKEIGECDEHVLSYFKTLDDGNGTINNASASIEGLSEYLQKSGQSFDTAALKATLLNAALNAGIILAVTLAVKALSAAWDYFNVTVEEQQEKISNLSSEIETLQQEYDELSSKQAITDAERERLDYLEKRLDLDKQILEAETIDLYKEQRGSKWNPTDWFDKESDVVKSAKEFGSMNDGGASLFSKVLTAGLSPFGNIYDFSALFNGYDKVVKSAEKPLERLKVLREEYAELEKEQGQYAKGSFEYELYQNDMDSNIEMQSKYLKKLENSYTDLLQKQGEYLQEAEKYKEQIDSGLLSGDDLTDAQEIYNKWNDAYNNISELTDSVAQVIGKTALSETSNAGNSIKDITQEMSDETPIKTFAQAWVELGDTADDKLKGVQEELLKLAEAGQLSADSLKEVEGAEQYFEDIELSAQEASNKINELVTSSSQLSSMRSGITSITGALSEKQSNNVVNADTLGKFDVSLQGLESWNEFEETLGNSKSSMEECQQAANNLATEYVNSNNFLSHLTEANKDYYVSQLSNMGVTNALEVVNASLVNSENALAVAQSEVTKYSESLADSKERNRIASIDLANASASDIQALFNEANAAGVATNGLRQLLAQKYNANNLAVSTAADCANLAQLYSQSLSTANALNALAQAKAAASSGKYIPHQQLEMMTASAQNSIKKANKQTQVAPQVQVAGGGSGGGGGGSSKSKESSKTLIDWIERRINVLTQKAERWANIIENATDPKRLDSYYKKLEENYKKQLKTYSNGATRYLQKANSIKLDAGLKNKVKSKDSSIFNKDGSMKSYKTLIKEYGEKTAKKIQDYQNWYIICHIA